MNDQPTGLTFTQLIQYLERGQFVRDADAAVQSIVEAISQNGSGSGSMTLKISLSYKDGSVVIKDHIDVKLPARERRSTTLFISDDNQLSTQHPDQIAMFEERRRGAIEGSVVAYPR